MEVTQTDKAITLDCGCNVDIIITAYSVSNLAVQSALSLCPLHRAADDLLAALKADQEYLPTCKDPDCGQCPFMRICTMGRNHAAIALAEEKAS